MFYIGIDPGVSGGIGVVSESGILIEAIKMPTTDRDVYLALDTIVGTNRQNGHPRAVLERVSASPQMGVVSAFTFGKSYGGLRMALAALEIRYDEVTPATWQKVMGCRTGGDKNVSKRRAQQLFPSLTITHAIADALLMAEYCRRVERGSIQRDPQGAPHGRTRSKPQEEVGEQSEGAQGAEAQGRRRIRFTETARTGAPSTSAKRSPAWPRTSEEQGPVEAGAVRR